METCRVLFKYAISKIDPYRLTLKSLKVENDTLLIAKKYFELDKNVYVIGFGKAVLGMALAIEHLMNKHIVKGILSVPQNTDAYSKSYETNLKSIQLFHGASHNLPDQNSLDTTLKILKLCESLPTKSSILLVLISGGGSALCCAPMPPLTLDIQLGLIKSLTRKGADIKEINTVRSSLSLIKGGKLPQFTPDGTQVISLIISDIIGDPLEFIASGPTVVPYFNASEALAILKKYKLDGCLPEAILYHLALNQGQTKDKISATIRDRVNNVLVGNNSIALQAVESKALTLGLHPVIMSSEISGEAKDFGKYLANLGLKLMLTCHEIVKNHANNQADNLDKGFLFDAQFFQEGCNQGFIKVSQPLLDSLNGKILKNLTHALRSGTPSFEIALVFGGETTVAMEHDCNGKGGRNQEIALAFLNHLAHRAINFPGQTSSLARSTSNCDPPEDLGSITSAINGLTLLSAGTDGQDGPTDAAGAIVNSQETTLKDFKTLYRDTLPYLERHDSYNFFQTYKDGIYHLKTGLTGTNVMDIQILTLKLKV